MKYGIEQISTTLSEINSDLIRQQFYEVRPGEYVPHIVGNQKWSTNIIFSTLVELIGDFEEGIVDTRLPQANLVEIDITTSSITSFITTWAKKILWIIPQN